MLWWRIFFFFLAEMWYLLLSGRWKEDSNKGKVLNPVSKRPILQFVSIKRKDCGQWAIPGVCCFDIFCIPFQISWVFVQCEHVCEVTMKCLSCRGWLIQGSRSLSRYRGSSPRRRWTRWKFRRRREPKFTTVSPNFLILWAFRFRHHHLSLTVRADMFWVRNED